MMMYSNPFGSGGFSPWDYWNWFWGGTPVPTESNPGGGSLIGPYDPNDPTFEVTGTGEAPPPDYLYDLVNPSFGAGGIFDPSVWAPDLSGYYSGPPPQAGGGGGSGAPPPPYESEGGPPTFSVTGYDYAPTEPVNIPPSVDQNVDQIPEGFVIYPRFDQGEDFVLSPPEPTEPPAPLPDPWWIQLLQQPILVYNPTDPTFSVTKEEKAPEETKPAEQKPSTPTPPATPVGPVIWPGIEEPPAPPAPGIPPAPPTPVYPGPPTSPTTPQIPTIPTGSGGLGGPMPGQMAPVVGSGPIASLFQGTYQPDHVPTLGELLLPILQGVANGSGIVPRPAANYSAR